MRYIYDRRGRRLVAEDVDKRSRMSFLHENPLRVWLSERLPLWRGAAPRDGRPGPTERSRSDIAKLIERHRIELDEVDRALGSFSTFREFFIRRVKPEARPVDPRPEVLISPADARVLAYPIGADTMVQVKGRRLTMAVLLDDPALARLFRGGTCVVLRLAQADYRRFCYVDHGAHGPVLPINGLSRALSAPSLRRMKAAVCEHYRELTLLATPTFGTIAQIDVGAMGIGRIRQHHARGAEVARGQEKGLFELGASAIVLLLEPGAARMDHDIAVNTVRGIETRVRYGERIGIAIA
jgi:phosphatidylserine decarboxylase